MRPNRRRLSRRRQAAIRTSGNTAFHLRDARESDIPALATLHVTVAGSVASSKTIVASWWGSRSPSNGFYEAFGAERLYSDSGEFHGGYGWRDLGTLLAKGGT